MTNIASVEPFKSWLVRHSMWINELSGNPRMHRDRMLDFYNHLGLLDERVFTTFPDDRLDAQHSGFLEFIHSESFYDIHRSTKRILADYPGILSQWYIALGNWIDDDPSLIENHSWVRDTLGYRFLHEHPRYIHYREDMYATFQDKPWMVGFFLEQLYHAHIKDISPAAIELTYGSPSNWPSIDVYGGLDAYTACARLLRAADTHPMFQAQLTHLAPFMTGHVNAMLGIDPWDSKEPIQTWAQRSYRSYQPPMPADYGIPSSSIFKV